MFWFIGKNMNILKCILNNIGKSSCCRNVVASHLNTSQVFSHKHSTMTNERQVQM